jgi:amino acid transporter
MAEDQRWSGAYVDIKYASFLMLTFTALKWAVASIFVLCIGMSMGELASAAPTSGGVRAYHLITRGSTKLSLTVVFLDLLPFFTAMA